MSIQQHLEHEDLDESFSKMTYEPFDIHSYRMEGICSYKCKEKHRYKDCPIFAHLKKKCTMVSYTGQELKQNDKDGYLASGVMIRSENKILFLRERRENGIKLNFPGGKRESIFEKGKLRAETYKETAANEFVEEMGDLVVGGRDNEAVQRMKFYLLNTEDLLTYWSGDSKYALIIVEADYEIQSVLKVKDPCGGSELMGFEWIHIDYIREDILHPFTYKFFKDIFNV